VASTTEEELGRRLLVRLGLCAAAILVAFGYGWDLVGTPSVGGLLVGGAVLAGYLVTLVSAVRDSVGHRGEAALEALWMTLLSTGEEALCRSLLVALLLGFVGLAEALALSVGFFAVMHAQGGLRLVRRHLVTGACFAIVALVCGGWLAAALAHATYNLVLLASLRGAGPARWLRSPATGQRPGKVPAL